MRRTAIAAALLLGVLLAMSAPAVVRAADKASSPPEESTLQRLLQVIDEQQKRLDAQDAQLAEQRAAMQAQQEMLQELRREVETLQGRSRPPASTQASAGTQNPSPGAEQPTPAAQAGQNDVWPGFYRVSGTDTQYKISGYVELDVIHDTKNVETPTAFVTQAIQTRGPGKDNGQTSFSVQATRLALETRTPLEGDTSDRPHRLTTFVAADFFNDLTSASPDFRLRQAYGEVSNFMHGGGDLLLGQDWSTYTSGYAIPDTMEFWAPNSIFGSRNPMVRWTMPLGDEFKLKLAAEAANLRNFETDNSYQIDSSDPIVNAANSPRWPDGTVALTWDREPFHLLGAFVARDLRAETDLGRTASAFGWGATFQGRIGMPDFLKDDFLQFSLTYGEGIGSLFNDFPPDAVYDVARNDLKPLETAGLLFGYHHQWSPQFHSLATYGWLYQDNESVQLPTAYHETVYSSLNLVWTPDPRWLLGAEVIYGSREDHDGISGSNVRTQVTSRFNF
jgi:hypothetical protein